MNTLDLFAYGNDIMSSGNLDRALEVWLDVSRKDPSFGPVYANMAEVHRRKGNVTAEFDCLNKFLSCPLTGITFKLLDPIEKRMEELMKILNPKK